MPKKAKGPISTQAMEETPQTTHEVALDGTEGADPAASTPISQRLKEIAEITSQIGPETRAILERAPMSWKDLDLGFISAVYSHNPDLAKKLYRELLKALNTLDERAELFIHERDQSAGWGVHAEICDENNLVLTDKNIRPPDRFVMSRYTVPAVTGFLGMLLHSKEFEVRPALAVHTEKDNMTKALWLTVIGLKRRNSIGGYDLVEPALLFVDASADMPPRGEKIKIDTTGNLGRYGLELYDPAIRSHRSCYNVADVDRTAERMTPDANQNSFSLFQALYAPDKLREFHGKPDLLAAALIDALKSGHKISKKHTDEIRGLLAPEEEAPKKLK